MRKINDMMKLIPPDELNGGITMKSMNKTDDNNKSNILDTKSRDNIKLRRGTSGIVAAALVLAIGGGALAVALTRKGEVKPASTAPDSIAAQDTQAEADAAAEKIYRLIDANRVANIADGYMSEIGRGEFTVDLAAPRQETENMFARSLGDKFSNEAKEYFHKITNGDSNIPETGEVFYVMNDKYDVEFVQYRAGKDAQVGQYCPVSCERTEFGVAPKFDKNAIQEKTYTDANTEYVHELYNIVDRMQNEYAFGEYPNNQLDAVVPDGFVSLDFDKRDEYADLIRRLEQFNTNNIALTGKVNFRYAMGNAPEFLEWTSSDGSSRGIWPSMSDDELKGHYSAQDEDAADRLGCSVYKLTTSDSTGSYNGVITKRDQLPQVFEWYEDFLSKNYEPAAFDPAKLMTLDELQKVVEYDWLDTDKKQQVYIRTSDMKGANIYVNGRYYNVEDTSVLTLLDNGLPQSVVNIPAK